MSFVNHNFFGGGKSPKKTQSHNMVGRAGFEIVTTFAQLYCGIMLGMLLFSEAGIDGPAAVLMLTLPLGAYCVLASETSHNKLGKHVFGGIGIASLVVFLIITLLIFTGYI